MKKELLKLTLLCLSLIFCFNVKLQAQEDKILSPKKAQKDFAELEKIIEAYPDPFTHISEKDFNRKLDSVKQTLKTPHTILEFYKKTAFVVALLKDGHSSARLPRDWMEKRRKKIGGLPYEFYLTNDDDLYVLKNFHPKEEGAKQKGMPVRAKILKINGIAVDSFLKIINPYISYELKRFRNTQIDNDFEKYLFLAFGFSDNTEFEYSFSGTFTSKVKNIPYKEWKKFRIDDRAEREVKIAKGKPYDYKKIAQGVGLISIYSFSVGDYQSYRIFLNNTFKSIQKDTIHSLVIDIRGNYGGWPKTASKLFHYISNSHFKTMAKSSTKISYAYRNFYTDRYPSLKYNKPTLRQRRHFVNLNAVLRNKIGSFSDEDIFFNEKPVTEDYEFTGDCYLLTNRDSYSAASNFAATFQCYEMGLIIGEKTGGTKILRANAIYEELYRSNVLIAMATTKMYATCFNEEYEGVKPTIEYTPSIFEVTSGLDTHLFYAQRIIKKVRAKKQSE